MKEELKTCPFCGKEGKIIDYLGAAKKRKWFVKCANLNCKVKPETCHLYGKEASIDAWNKRVDNGGDK